MEKATLHFFCLLVFISSTVAIGRCEEPVEATVCQIKKDPPAYNHKLIEVTGFVSHAFENFSIFDPTCPDWPWIWLEYGGTSSSGTMYCCGVTADRHRRKQLTVEHVSIPLVENVQFKEFDKAIQPPFRSGQHGAIVHATLIGRFFAGRRIEYFKGKPWGGYGHMGCCTLLAIQEVKSADTQNRSDLDYGASTDQPDIDKAGCGYQFLLPLHQTSTLMQWQQEADAGEREWAFEDSQRVASDTLSRLVKIDPASLTGMKLKREIQGRRIYEWEPSERKQTYMIVVSRPYWLSFYSRDANRVAWAPLAAYESSCSGKNAVTRVK